MKRVWIIMVLAGLLYCTTATGQETIIPYRPGFGPVDEGKVYDVVEQMPSFPGGPAALMEFINRTKVYPVSAFNQYKELSDAYPRMSIRLAQLSQYALI